MLLFGYHTSTAGPMNATPDIVVASTATPELGTSDSSESPGETSGSGPGSSGSGGDSPQPTSTGPSAFTGSTAQTRWGPVQVKIVVTDGRVTDVTVPQYPNGNSKDQQINSRALPALIRETLDAQGAQIDMVSGATVTSDGYIQSLQAALDEAGL
ncbi:MAG: FMN-binding protein [Rhodococcus sp. (in: high G+C Gram-positive bacteria)]|nr:MAG: FMN-binding protein [Rhodococcus sp. (in: high G+C Gram-positive bacteria)]